MLELVAKKEEIKRQGHYQGGCMKMFGDRGEEYKTELISELEDGTITTYTQVLLRTCVEGRTYRIPLI